MVSVLLYFLNICCFYPFVHKRVFPKSQNSSTEQTEQRASLNITSNVTGALIHTERKTISVLYFFWYLFILKTSSDPFCPLGVCLDSIDLIYEHLIYIGRYPQCPHWYWFSNSSLTHCANSSTNTHQSPTHRAVNYCNRQNQLIRLLLNKNKISWSF